jgi:hypothetical protein
MPREARCPSLVRNCRSGPTPCAMLWAVRGPFSDDIEWSRSEADAEHRLLRSRQRLVVLVALLGLAAVVAVGIGCAIWMVFDFVVEGARD